MAAVPAELIAIIDICRNEHYLDVVFFVQAFNLVDRRSAFDHCSIPA
jgi:hypothetical protein